MRDASSAPGLGAPAQRAAARAEVLVRDLVRPSSSSSASSRDLVEHVVVFQYKGIKVEVMVEVLAIWQLLSTSDRLLDSQLTRHPRPLLSAWKTKEAQIQESICHVTFLSGAPSSAFFHSCHRRRRCRGGYWPCSGGTTARFLVLAKLTQRCESIRWLGGLQKKRT